MFDLEQTVCISAKLAVSLAVAILVVVTCITVAYQRALSRARAAARAQAKQLAKKQAPSQPSSRADAAAVSDGAAAEEVTVSADEQATAKQFGMLDGPYKLVLLVNMSLKMEKGKVAAQCGHATLACYKKSLKMSPAAVSWWERLGQAKIALKVNDESEMEAIQAKAKALGLATYIVEDAGRTQIAAGSRTVLGIGPAPVKVIDSITSHLKLL